MVLPLFKRCIKKKKHVGFIVSKQILKRVPLANWRRPKGIDSAVRRKFKGRTLIPNIGYRSERKTRYMLTNGFKKVVINNIGDLETLFMQNRTFEAEIAHGVSCRNRLKILERAEHLNISVRNSRARFTRDISK